MAVDLTTQEAADLLHVSQAYFISLLEEKRIPFYTVRIKQRILFQNVMDYKNTIDEARRITLNELSQEAQDLGMGY